MSACSQCGTVVKPTDKFCNVCGSPITRSSSAPPPGQPYPAPAATAYSPGNAPAPVPTAGNHASHPPSPGVSSPPPARCQLGHEIAAGLNYCAQGHPIALEQVQFANDPYGQKFAAPAANAQPHPGQRPSAAPYGTPPPAQTGYGGQPTHPSYNPPPPQAAYAHAFAPAPPPPPYPGQVPPPQGAPAYGVPPYAAHAPSPYLPPQADPSRDVGSGRVLRGFLVTYGTNPGGDFWPLSAGRLSIGRFGTGDGLDIALQDPTISSRHAAVIVDGSGAVLIEDTGSTNGTFVNDEHIGYGGRRELRDGDRIRFGGFTTIVKVIGRV